MGGGWTVSTFSLGMTDCVKVAQGVDRRPDRDYFFRPPLVSSNHSVSDAYLSSI